MPLATAQTKFGPSAAAREIEGKEIALAAQVPGVEIYGSPGSGKTALLESTILRLGALVRIGVIVAHLAARRDALRLERAGAAALPLEVVKLNKRDLQELVNADSTFSQNTDLLFVETPGQLFNGPPPKIDHIARVGVFSITGGDDKAAEYSDRVQAADIILLTKMDLLEHVDFDLNVFRNDVRRINPDAKLIELSASSGWGMDGWIDWLVQHTIRVRTNWQSPVTPDRPEWWFG